MLDRSVGVKSPTSVCTKHFGATSADIACLTMKNTSKKSVSFGGRIQVSVMEIIHVDDISAELAADIWWTKEEIYESRTEYEAILFLMETGEPVDENEHAARGLEKRTEDGAWELYEIQRDARNAVLSEQDRQKKRKVSDANDIALAFQTEALKAAGRAARDAAIRDENEVKDYLGRENGSSDIPTKKDINIANVAKDAKSAEHQSPTKTTKASAKFGRRTSMPLMEKLEDRVKTRKVLKEEPRQSKDDVQRPLVKKKKKSTKKTKSSREAGEMSPGKEPKAARDEKKKSKSGKKVKKSKSKAVKQAAFESLSKCDNKATTKRPPSSQQDERTRDGSTVEIETKPEDVQSNIETKSEEAGKSVLLTLPNDPTMLQQVPTENQSKKTKDVDTSTAENQSATVQRSIASKSNVAAIPSESPETVEARALLKQADEEARATVVVQENFEKAMELVKSQIAQMPTELTTTGAIAVAALVKQADEEARATVIVQENFKKAMELVKSQIAQMPAEWTTTGAITSLPKESKVGVVEQQITWMRQAERTSSDVDAVSPANSHKLKSEAEKLKQEIEALAKRLLVKKESATGTKSNLAVKRAVESSFEAATKMPVESSKSEATAVLKQGLFEQQAEEPQGVVKNRTTFKQLKDPAATAIKSVVAKPSSCPSKFEGPNVMKLATSKHAATSGSRKKAGGNTKAEKIKQELKALKRGPLNKITVRQKDGALKSEADKIKQELEALKKRKIVNKEASTATLKKTTLGRPDKKPSPKKVSKIQVAKESTLAATTALMSVAVTE